MPRRLTSPIQRQLDAHHHRAARRQPDLFDAANHVAADDAEALAELIRCFHAGDTDAAMAALWGISRRIGGLVVTTVRPGPDEAAAVLDEYLTVAYLVLVDIDPELTYLGHRIISRTRRRVIRRTRRDRPRPTIELDPARDHPDLATDDTSQRALDRVTIAEVADRARHLVDDADWQLLLAHRIDGLPTPTTGRTPSGNRSTLSRTTHRLRIECADLLAA